MFARNNKLLKEIASRLVQARKQSGLSAKQMASHMEMTFGGYQKNERGENFPGVVTLRRLVGDFDISLDWLLANKGPMHHKAKTKREIELEQEKAAEERKKAFDMRPDVRELLDYMEKDNVFYYQSMLNFHEIKKGKKENGDYPRIPPPPGQSREIN